MPTIEKMLTDLCCWEDPDSMLVVSTTESGGVFLMDHEGRETYEAPTLQEALHQMWTAHGHLNNDNSK